MQTLAPEARSIRCAAEHDSDGFVSQELAHRQALGYPPYGSLIRLICASPDAGAAAAGAEELRGLIGPEAGIVLGPAPLFRLRGRSRHQLLIKAADRAAAVAAVGRAVDAAAAGLARRNVSISVDVDPQ